MIVLTLKILLLLIIFYGVETRQSYTAIMDKVPQKDTPPPGKRTGSRGVTMNNKGYVFADSNQECEFQVSYDDTGMEIGEYKCNEIIPDSPLNECPRTAYGSETVFKNRVMFFYGGRGENFENIDSLCYLERDEMKYHSISNISKNILGTNGGVDGGHMYVSNHTGITGDTENIFLFVFGGMKSDGKLNENFLSYNLRMVWNQTHLMDVVLDNVADMNTMSTYLLPPRLYAHYWSVGKRLFMYGGMGCPSLSTCANLFDVSLYNDVWVLQEPTPGMFLSERVYFRGKQMKRREGGKAFIYKTREYKLGNVVQDGYHFLFCSLAGYGENGYPVSEKFVKSSVECFFVLPGEKFATRMRMEHPNFDVKRLASSFDPTKITEFDTVFEIYDAVEGDDGIYTYAFFGGFDGSNPTDDMIMLFRFLRHEKLLFEIIIISVSVVAGLCCCLCCLCLLCFFCLGSGTSLAILRKRKVKINDKAFIPLKHVKSTSEVNSKGNGDTLAVRIIQVETPEKDIVDKEQEEKSGFKELRELLEEHSLDEYIPIFKKEKVIIHDLEHMSESEFEKFIPDSIPRNRFMHILRKNHPTSFVAKNSLVVGGGNPKEVSIKSESIKSLSGDKKEEKIDDEESSGESEEWLLDKEKNVIEFGKVLNTGAFGVVRKGTIKFGMGKIDVAIKEIAVNEQVKYEDIKHEVLVMVELSNDNVLQCFGCFFENNNEQAYIVLELCEKGDLFNFKRKRTFSTDLKLKFLIEIAKGMSFLHSKNIVHRDLKTQNILVTNDLKVKICDFGTSKHTRSISQTLCGTVEYLAPEQLDTTIVSPNPKLIDVYSFGIMIFEVWTQDDIFVDLKKECKNNQFEMLQKINTGNLRPDIKKCDGMDENLFDLMTSCWSRNPNERPDTFDVILSELKDIMRESRKKK